MRVLQLHNRYEHRGGEDVVVDSEFDLMHKAGIDCRQLLFDNKGVRAIDVFYNGEARRRLRERIQAFKPDLVHAHNLFYKASPSILEEANKLGVPVVMTLHNFRLVCPNAMFMRDNSICTKCLNKKLAFPAIKHRCFKDSRMKSAVLASALGYHNLMGSWRRNVDHFLVLTPFIRNLLLSSSLGLNPEKVSVKPNSTDQIDGLPSGTKRTGPYVAVGRLSKEKGLNTLIEAFNQMPGLRLQIIGDGPIKEELRALAGPNIEFTGPQKKDFVQNALKKAPALLFSSFIFEGLPNTIIEAFSAGTPVIASDVDNINQIVEAGVNGQLFIPKSQDDLVRTIKEFELEEGKRLQDGARETYNKKYTHQQNLSALMSVYQAVAKNK